MRANRTSKICSLVLVLRVTSVVWFFLTFYLVSCAELLFFDNGLDVFFLTACSLRDRLSLIELRPILTNYQAAVESEMTEARRLEERIRAAENTLEALCVHILTS